MAQFWKLNLNWFTVELICNLQLFRIQQSLSKDRLIHAVSRSIAPHVSLKKTQQASICERLLTSITYFRLEFSIWSPTKRNEKFTKIIQLTAVLHAHKTASIILMTSQQFGFIVRHKGNGNDWSSGCCTIVGATYRMAAKMLEIYTSQCHDTFSRICPCTSILLQLPCNRQFKGHYRRTLVGVGRQLPTLSWLMAESTAYVRKCCLLSAAGRALWLLIVGHKTCQSARQHATVE